MSTHTLTVGAATQHLFITRNHRGTSEQHQLKTNSYAKTLPLIGIQKLLKLVDTVIGSITTSTGLCPAIDIGAHRYLFGAARINTKSVSNPWLI
jgi:hypothetical protein